MANRVRLIAVSEADRHELERLQRAPSTPSGLSRRARAVLLMVQGMSGVRRFSGWVSGGSRASEH